MPGFMVTYLFESVECSKINDKMLPLCGYGHSMWACSMLCNTFIIVFVVLPIVAKLFIPCHFGSCCLGCRCFPCHPNHERLNPILPYPIRGDCLNPVVGKDSFIVIYESIVLSTELQTIFNWYPHRIHTER